MKKCSIFIFLLTIFGFNASAGGPKLVSESTLKDANVYLITVGVNTFRGQNDMFVYYRDNSLQKLPELAGCVSDANGFNAKVSSDFEKLKVSGQTKNMYSISLNDKSATKDSLKHAFEWVARESKPKDIFIFFYAGITRENRKGESFIIPYLTQTTDSLFENPDLIQLNTIAKWMNSIQANHQLIVSEAGMGEAFSLNLIEQLFESNPVLASQNLRNRLILSTKKYGYDSHKDCEKNQFLPGGPLNYNILRYENLFFIFSNPDLYEFNIHQLERSCSPGAFPYAILLQEQSFAQILSHRVLKTRGSVLPNSPSSESKSDKGQDSELGPQNYALVLATDVYEGKPDWENLGNPKNDAREISNLLEKKLGCKVNFLHNISKDSLTWELIRYRSILRENDNLIIFIAGHGYYDSVFTEGYLVMPKSLPLKKDRSHDSYYDMASLNRLIDNLPSKNIFVIFDICFGASFDFKAKDLPISDYKTGSDIGIDELINRKKGYCSRIFLCSGKGSVYDYWFNSGTHSPFASKLIDYLKNENDLVCPGRLYKAVEQNVTEPVIKEFGQHDAKGDMILKVIK
jgi:hypothetical protein